MKYNDLTLGQMEAIVNKLGGMDGVKIFLSGVTIVKEIGRSLRIFKTIKLGTGLTTAEELINAIHKYRRSDISNAAHNLMQQKAFTVAKKETSINLFIASVADFGFKQGTTYKNICSRAKKLGLELCPAEVGPQLRLQYMDQPRGETLSIAMKPITGSLDEKGIFEIVNHDDLGLRFTTAESAYLYDNDHQFVFCFRK